jgi:hypothetical protein
MKKRINAIVTDFKDILVKVLDAGRRREIIKIYYPKTDNSKAGWRNIQVYSLAIDPGPGAEHLIAGKDRISPGHILNAYTIGSRDKHCDSFILGKIKAAKLTNKKFRPKVGWKVEI